LPDGGGRADLNQFRRWLRVSAAQRRALKFSMGSEVLESWLAAPAGGSRAVEDVEGMSRGINDSFTLGDDA
jgi:hypothetical protein